MFLLGSRLLPACCFSSLVRLVSSCLLTSHISNPSGSSFCLSPFSLYHCYIVVLFPPWFFLLPFPLMLLYPLHFHLFHVGNMRKACFPPLCPHMGKLAFVVLSRTASMIHHYLKRIVYQLVLCKQLKTVFVTGDTGLTVLPMKILFF